MRCPASARERRRMRYYLHPRCRAAPVPSPRAVCLAQALRGWRGALPSLHRAGIGSHRSCHVAKLPQLCSDLDSFSLPKADLGPHNYTINLSLPFVYRHVVAFSPGPRALMKVTPGTALVAIPEREPG